ncbi:hypothetical protein GCM10020256_24920 [Streptomyces thermocoprophilus]
MGAQPYAVLGDDEGYAEEVAGEQPGEGRGAAGCGMAHVDGAESVLLVPVEAEGAQGAFEVGGDGEQIRYAGLARRAEGARGAAGAFQGVHRTLGAECAAQSALVPGEFSEAVQRGAETVRLGGVRLVRAVRVPYALGARAQGAREFAVVLGEPPACAAAECRRVALPDHSGAVRTLLTLGGSGTQPSSSCCSLRLSA